MIFTGKRFQQTKDGTKTQTRRLALPYDNGTGEIDTEMISYPNGIKSVCRIKAHGDHWTVRYQVGAKYAMQPGRGKRGDGKVLVLDLELDEDVTDITPEDAKAEGFETVGSFLSAWMQMHDRTNWHEWTQLSHIKDCQQQHPERYRAWKITYFYVPPVDARKEFLESMGANTPEGNAILDKANRITWAHSWLEDYDGTQRYTEGLNQHNHYADMIAWNESRQIEEYWRFTEGMLTHGDTVAFRRKIEALFQLGGMQCHPVLFCVLVAKVSDTEDVIYRVLLTREVEDNCWDKWTDDDYKRQDAEIDQFMKTWGE